VEYNQKVDMWSVGVLMYYLLSGTHPFEGDSEDLGMDIINAELTFPDDRWKPISSKGMYV
jgi:serine/threonine protein kinase